jgi:hypothetical protein
LVPDVIVDYVGGYDAQYHSSSVIAAECDKEESKKHTTSEVYQNTNEAEGRAQRGFHR